MNNNSGQFVKGGTPWNKGKHPEYVQGENHPMYGKKHSEETKKKFRAAKLGKAPPNKGKTKKDYPNLSNSGVKKGNISWNKGKKYPQISGENNCNWAGGKSLGIYTVDWTKTLRKSIRERDRYICQLCQEAQGDEALCVHHIDYNKKNCNPNNLISLCRSCHAKTISNRKYWKEYFNNKLKMEKLNGD